MDTRSSSKKNYTTREEVLRVKKKKLASNAERDGTNHGERGTALSNEGTQTCRREEQNKFCCSTR